MYLTLPFVVTPACTAFGGTYPRDAGIHCRYFKMAFEGSGITCFEKILINLKLVLTHHTASLDLG